MRKITTRKLTALGRHFIALATLLHAVGTHAADVGGLYEAEVPVPSKEVEERQLAFSAALRNVLIKLTGSRNPQSRAAVLTAMSQPDAYVEQYQYRTLSLEPLDELELASEELVLWTRFAAQAIDRLVREAGLPLWGRTRPSMLVWLALENESTRALVGEQQSSTLVSVLRDAASRRGVPLVIPALDEADQATVTVADIWAGFDERVVAASARYQPDQVLTVRGYRTAGGDWESRWRLLASANGSSGATPTEWLSKNTSLDALLAQGVDRAADILATRYATAVPAGSGSEQVDVTVHQVHGVADYARVVSYLNGIDGISKVQVTGVAADRVELALEARGGSPVVMQLISLGRVLTRMPGDDGLKYRLGP